MSEAENADQQATDEEGRTAAIVLAAWSAIARTGSTAELAAILHEDVVWHGAMPQSISRGRDEVLSVLSGNDAPRLTRFDVLELGDRVLLIMEGPDFPLTEGHKPGLRCLTFTLRRGQVVKIQTLGKHDFTVD